MPTAIDVKDQKELQESVTFAKSIDARLKLCFEELFKLGKICKNDSKGFLIYDIANPPRDLRKFWVLTERDLKRYVKSLNNMKNSRFLLYEKIIKQQIESLMFQLTSVISYCDKSRKKKERFSYSEFMMAINSSNRIVDLLESYLKQLSRIREY